MTSETDQPRQRTVAELLAAHGDPSATPRRRRRRAADEPSETDSQPLPGPGRTPSRALGDAGPAVPDRRILREPVPRNLAPPPGPRPDTRAAATTAQPVPAFPPAESRPSVETPTDTIPRFRDAAPRADTNATVFAPSRPLREPRPEEPDTIVSARPAGARPWTEEPARGRRAPETDDDGGPPTEAGVPFSVDDDFDDEDDAPTALGPRRGLGRRDDTVDRDPGRDLDDDYDAADYHDEDYRDADEDYDDDHATERGAAGANGAWTSVVAQWILGAIGGAALWVGFRFLWRDLPVVAIAAAVLVTVGLVLLVRQLLRSSDTRTTVFAVLVGLLLTVSPALLILMGR